MQESKKMIRIDPSDAPDFVTRVLDSIVDTLQNSPEKYSATPGAIENFKTIEGDVKDNVTQKDCKFFVQYNKPSSRGKPELIHVKYDNFEFYLTDNNSGTRKFFDSANTCIREKYVYDWNSKTYALRPRELTFFQDIKQSFLSKFGKQKTK